MDIESDGGKGRGRGRGKRERKVRAHHQARWLDAQLVRSM